MRISDTPRLTPGSSAGKTSRSASDGGAFSSMLNASPAASAAQTGGASSLSAPAALSSLLALQEVSAEEQKRRKMLKRGELTLDALENIRVGLLTGSIPRHILQNLEQQIQQAREEFPDPALADLLDDIELRAAVELAKLGM